jgi:formate hydrogenlyase subunit 3/multisubunit Na+/H+ antiporter MnhD subunit
MAAIATVAASNLIIFYGSWEILCLATWGLGRWGTNLAGKEGLPANPATALASLAMFAAIAILAYDNKTLEMQNLQAENSKLIAGLVLGACFLKVYGTLGPAWRSIEPRAFSVSQGIVASVATSIIGMYPISRLLHSAIDWSGPWEGMAAWGGGVTGLIFILAAIGKAGEISTDTPQAPASWTASGQSMSYGILSYYCWGVAVTAILGRGFFSAQVYWMLAAGLGWGALFLIVGAAKVGDVASGVGILTRWTGGAIFALAILIAGANIGMPPLIGFVARMFISFWMMSDEKILATAAFSITNVLLFGFLFRLLLRTLFTSTAHQWHTTVPLSATALAACATIGLVTLQPSLINLASDWLRGLGS